jgi:hypothetical protein
MIISHKHRFIFIKNLKTAGTSLEVYIARFCGPEDVITSLIPPEEGHQPQNDAGYFNLISAADVRQKVGPEIWNSYYKFCLERNPWDKTLAYYYMMKTQQGGRLELDKYLKSKDFPLNYPRYPEPG